MRHAVLMVAGLLAASMVGGCVDQPDPASLIQTVRILGARLEVEGDPSRAWPMPGETVDANFVVAGNEQDRPLDWLMLACPTIPVRSGLPICAGGPDTFVIQRGSDVPKLALPIPEADALPGEPDYAVLGVVCAGGTVRLDAGPESIENGESLCNGDDVDETKVTLSIHVQYGEETNHNPRLSSSFVTFADAQWIASSEPSPSSGCADAEETAVLPRASRAANEKIDLALDPDETMRETYTAEVGDPPKPVEAKENFVISVFATAGELAHQFTVIDDDHPDGSVEYTLPDADEIPADGLLVHFYFVVRDERGGLDHTERVACIVP